MTRQAAIDLAHSKATEIPMASIEVVAGVIDVLAALDLVRFTSEEPATSELVQHRAA